VGASRLQCLTFYPRGKVCDELEDFMREDDRNRFSMELEDAENWLYEDGEYAEKRSYM
jgi:hypothetical protein